MVPNWRSAVRGIDGEQIPTPPSLTSRSSDPLYLPNPRQSHLDVNPVGKKTLQDLACESLAGSDGCSPARSTLFLTLVTSQDRGFICQTIAQSLVDLFVPNPSDLPKSSAEDLGGLGRNMAEMSAKYSVSRRYRKLLLLVLNHTRHVFVQALDALGDLLSKNEKNKSFVKNLFPP